MDAREAEPLQKNESFERQMIGGGWKNAFVFFVWYREQSNLFEGELGFTRERPAIRNGVVRIRRESKGN